MHRLFVALRPPPSIRDACLEAMDDGPSGWAWQDDEQLHITMRYIGEVERPLAEDIASMMEGFRGSIVELALAGVGWFDHGPRGALFARISPKAPLEALHDKLDRALVRIGLDPERRAFLPHITLARRRRSAEDPAIWLERHAGLSSTSAICDHLTLFESHLGRNGATYEPVMRVRLAG